MYLEKVFIHFMIGVYTDTGKIIFFKKINN